MQHTLHQHRPLVVRWAATYRPLAFLAALFAAAAALAAKSGSGGRRRYSSTKRFCLSSWPCGRIVVVLPKVRKDVHCLHVLVRVLAIGLGYLILTIPFFTSSYILLATITDVERLLVIRDLPGAFGPLLPWPRFRGPSGLALLPNM
jgi:hypothetical protein